VLWFHPKLVDHTGHTLSEVLPAAATAVHGGVQEASLAKARQYVSEIVAAATTTTTTTMPATTTTIRSSSTATSTAPVSGAASSSTSTTTGGAP
jgi:hypothetical protein